jgi:hypothetical protein
MMKVFFDTIVIAACWVFVLDVSGFWETFSSAVKGWMTKGLVRTPFSLRPFSCSLCMTFWSGLLYLAVTGHFTLYGIAAVCLASYMTPTIADGLLLLRDLMGRLFNALNK